jgi:uncharacterized protein
LQINVAQLLKDSIGATSAFDYAGPIEIEEAQVEVSLNAALTHIDGGVLVRADIRTGLPVTCVRCLELFTSHLEFEIVEEYCQTIPVDGGGKLDVTCPPESFTIDNRHIIDLTEAVRQHALLTLPMQPLCDRDCRGICPRCGANLNRADCDCDRR